MTFTTLRCSSFCKFRQKLKIDLLNVLCQFWSPNGHNLQLAHQFHGDVFENDLASLALAGADLDGLPQKR